MICQILLYCLQNQDHPSPLCQTQFEDSLTLKLSFHCISIPLRRALRYLPSLWSLLTESVIAWKLLPLGCVPSNSKPMLMFSKAFPFALPHKLTSNEAEFKHMSLSESENHLRMLSVAILVLFLASCFWNWMQFTHENSASAGRHSVVKLPWFRQLLRESHPYIHRNCPWLLHLRGIWMARRQGVAREDRRTKTNHLCMSASLLMISTSVNQAQRGSFSGSLDFFHGRGLCLGISFNRLLNPL
jgi:hypothetical protein